jgi:hypothetical protein
LVSIPSAASALEQKARGPNRLRMPRGQAMSGMRLAGAFCALFYFRLSIFRIMVRAETTP